MAQWLPGGAKVNRKGNKQLMRTVVAAVAVRVLVALCTRTFFQPDEFFQSLEPAHRFVFGYGRLTWEWTADPPIRSFLYPVLNVPVYWLIKAIGVDDAFHGALLIAAPKVLHGALAAMTDIWVCELARVLLGERYVSTVLLVSLTSFFHALCLSRSLSNSLETSLTTVAFAYYPWAINNNVKLLRARTRKSLVVFAIACAIRPASAVVGTYIYLRLLWRLRRTNLLSKVIVDVFVIGCFTLFSIFVFDSLYYHRPTFTPLNFLITNLSSVSLFYGTNPWHFYLTQALPILCTTALPFVVDGAWRALSRRDAPLTLMFECVVWTLAIYSMTGHKEWRFIHPLLPLLHVFAAKSLVESNHKPETKSTSKAAGVKAKTWIVRIRDFIPPIRLPHLAILLSSLPASLWVMTVYCRAPISVMAYLRQLPVEELRESVGFLMPCHSTPWQAYLHKPELALDNRVWALGCEPPLGAQNLTTYRDQTDVFYDSPRNYLERYFPGTVDRLFPPSPFPTSIPGVVNDREDVWEHEWPRHLVFFGFLLDQKGVLSFFVNKGYSEVWRAGQDWEGDERRRGKIRIWRYQDHPTF